MLEVRNNWENLEWLMDGESIDPARVKSVDIQLKNGREIVRIARCKAKAVERHATVHDHGHRYGVKTTDIEIELPIGYDSKDTVKVRLYSGKISGKPILNRVVAVQLKRARRTS